MSGEAHLLRRGVAPTQEGKRTCSVAHSGQGWLIRYMSDSLAERSHHCLKFAACVHLHCALSRNKRHTGDAPSKQPIGAGVFSQRTPGIVGGKFFKVNLSHLAFTWVDVQGDLPAEVQDVVLFSDGPGSGQEEENHGWANLWRHQGLRF